MDYSSSIHDTDNPAAASPWGSSPVPSPQHNRSGSGFGTSSNRPSSPSPYHENRDSSGGYSNDGEGGFNGPERSTEDSIAGNGERLQRPDIAQSVQSEAQGFAQQHQVPIAQPNYEHVPASQEPQRHQQEPARQQSRPQAPQYKLQAKITGLERTGRKDPILRFDIYVSELRVSVMNLLVDVCRQIFQRSERHNSAMSVEHTPNL
jgi:hypothetical protein